MKAQVSTEYLIINSALLAVILAMTAIAYNNILELNLMKERFVAQAALDKIYTYGLTVYYQGDGAKRTFLVELPENINMTYDAANKVLILTLTDSQITRYIDYPFNLVRKPRYGGRVRFEVRNNAGVVEARAR